jgi:hypothetical protein
LLAAAVVAGVLKGSCATAPMPLPKHVSLAGFGGAARRDFLSTLFPWVGFSRYFKAAAPESYENNPLFPKLGLFWLQDQLGENLIVVNIDVVAVTKSMSGDVAAQFRALGVSPESVQLVATHTHSGPGGLVDSFPFEVGATDTFQPLLWEGVLAKIREMAFHSKKDLQFVDVYRTRVPLFGVAKNRRSDARKVFETGKILTLESVKHQKVECGLLAFPVHGTALGMGNRRLSGDVPRMLSNVLESEFPASKFLFVPEAAADMGPQGKGESGLEEMRAAFSQNLRKSNENPSGVFLRTTQVVELGLPRFDASNCAQKPSKLWTVFPPMNLSFALPTSATLRKYEIGEDEFHFWPGELTQSLGAKVGQNLGVKLNSFAEHISKSQKSIWNVTLANDYLGYFTSPSEWMPSYEVCASFYGRNGGLNLTR